MKIVELVENNINDISIEMRRNDLRCRETQWEELG